MRNLCKSRRKILFAIGVLCIGIFLFAALACLSGCKCEHVYSLRSTGETADATLCEEQDGYEVWVCSNCGGNRQTQIKESLGHDLSYKIAKNSETGALERIYTCSRCDYTTTFTYVKEVEANCSNSGVAAHWEGKWRYVTYEYEKIGWDTYDSTWWGKDYSRDVNSYIKATWYDVSELRNENFEVVSQSDLYLDIDSSNHVWSGATASATCTTGASGQHTCTLCNKTEYFTENPLGHNYSSYVTNPTCTEQGYTTYTCTRCGDSYVGDYVSATGHTYGDWVTVKEETCTENGSRQHVCQSCGASESEIVLAKHVYSSAGSTVSPTCTEQGYTLYTCSRCNETVKSDLVEAYGHNFTVTWTWDGYESASAKLVCKRDSAHTYERTATITSETTPATCTADGQTVYTASVYVDEVQYTDTKTKVLTATGHSSVVDSAVEATCTAVGKTEGSHCATCGEVLVAQTDIPMLAHSDTDYDGYCNVCSTFIEKITQIDSEDGLKLIINDLTAAYVLTADITLSDSWAGIGTESDVFSGKLYGNGHSISGLTYTATPCPGGLFIVNQGLIDGVTLKNFSLTMYRGTYTAEATLVFGGFAAYNYGKITNCKIDGTNTVKATSGWSLEQATCSYTFICGAICGVNYGTIDGCEIGGVITSTFSAKCYAFHNGIGSFSEYGTVNLTAYYGSVAGRNVATISNTTVTATQVVKLTANADQMYGADTSTVNVYSYVGSLVGTNEGTIKDCSAKACTFEQTKNETSDNCYANITINDVQRYSGILGADSGTISNLSITL